MYFKCVRYTLIRMNWLYHGCSSASMGENEEKNVLHKAPELLPTGGQIMVKLKYNPKVKALSKLFKG